MTTDAQFWNRIARKYAKDPIKNMTAYEATMTRVEALLSPQDKVLEVGCGTGPTALRLARFTGAYTGADISEEMIAIARERLAAEPVPGLDFTVAPVRETRFSPEGYDKVLAFNLLHLVDNLPGALLRAHQLLKPGGLYVTKTPCLAQMGIFVRLLIPLLRMIGKAPEVLFFTREELEAEMARAGFEVVESRVFDGAPHSRYLVARKV
jgi:ubiquinone/menaquinone biosynthesis C-methylase UbiE